ncbi:MAG: hypothetical protein ACPGGK_11425 [Pikeienuella sp.]
MDNAIYQTTRSVEAKDKLLRNLSIAGMAFMALWMAPRLLGPEYLPPIVQNLLAAVAFLTLFKQGLTLLYTRNPLIIHNNHIIIAGFRKVRLEHAHITGLGTYEKTGQPCLEYNDEAKKHKGQIKLPWELIAEPQDEVVDALKTALASK